MKRIGYLVILFMVLYGLTTALTNPIRPIIPFEWKHKSRAQLYFMNMKYLFLPYKNAVKALGESDNGAVGLFIGEDHWEYPFWILARLKEDKPGRRLTFRHVGVKNRTRNINTSLLLPKYIIARKSIKTWKHASNYKNIYVSKYVSVHKYSRHKNIKNKTR